jgi:hypothetical protein
MGHGQHRCGLVGTELHTASDEVPKNRLDALREQLLVRVTHARRSTEVNRIRNEARAEDGVVPRLVVWESNNIVGAPVRVDSPWTMAPSAVALERKADIWARLALPSRPLKIVETTSVLFVADPVR